MGKRKGRRPAAKARGGAGGGGRELRPESEPEAEKIEEEAEGESDFCFVCKDGGDLRLCDYRNCHKAYHPHCVGEGEDFLKSDDEFICRWHQCFICKRRSCFRCLCCPGNSVCRACLTQADFVQVGNQTKGFCANCLRLAIMIEENVEVDSDGEKVDFGDKSTYEFLFKDYWEIIKEKEGLTLDNLQEVHACLDCNRENFRKEQSSDDDFLGNIDDGDDEPIHPSNKVKALKKQGKSKKNAYVGWGSKELIEFLTSIGKDASKSLDQFGAAEAVKEYIRQKGLSQKDKKKYVKCDDKLLPLFRKKEIRFTKIYSLLERHIAANATSEDETLASSEDNSDSFRKKKSRTMTSEPSTPKGISERYRRCFASLVRDNIKLIYLRKSLVMDMLKQPETFENKVIGCFVRVKNDPKYCTYHRPKTMYQLGQVTGIGKSSEEYKIRDISTNMLLRISSCWSEVKISMLSDEDFEEDECEDLRLLVKKEHSQRHTVAELEEKVRKVHRDIVSHGIDKELQRLEKLIEVANEKGWRYEYPCQIKIFWSFNDDIFTMHGYIERRRLLRTPSERQRLLEEVPQVIADLEDTKDPELLVETSDKSFQIDVSVLQGSSGEGAVCLESCSQEISKGASEEKAHCLKSCSEDKSKGANEKAGCLKSCPEEKFEDTNEQTVCFRSCSEENPKATEADACTRITCVQNQAIAVKCNAAGGTPRTYAQNKDTQGSKDNAAGDRLEMDVQKKGTEVKCNAAGDAPRTYAQNKGTQGSEDNAASDRLEMHVQKKGTEATAAGIPDDVIIIDDDDDEDEDYSLPDEGANITVDLDANKSRDTDMVQHQTRHGAVWFYTDPQNDVQGPFPLEMLRRWKEDEYFDDDFIVWRAGQSSDSAILLTDALRLKR
ncbi:hypothetical protein QYE76_013147 [Lolium multiflorum]|uniref:Uncharacterized protein n=1 Tax=Lolium multiflorum TaxID=4521 RepID=A0AAD8U2I3_LOLMU|nr:hypothetical protein QYE76_013147 [Lolium multiflorum]